MNTRNSNCLKNNSVSITKAILIYVLVSLFLAFEMAVQVSPSVMAQDLMHDLNLGVIEIGRAHV